MRLSIIIVSYNVKFFLKQCLNSVYDSIADIDAEVIIVDNDSSDGSIEMIQQEFPQATLLENQKNVGFGSANNQALAIAKGRYTLFLNPDTIITKENIQLSLKHLESNADIGALGIKLLDGAGNYHPESKRGFPSAWTAFSKLSGLYKLFPNSSFFNYYYLGHLSENEVHDVDVLCGAYIMAPTEILQKLDGFDEDFFMYGEDIDLCKRIKSLGYRVVFYPKTAMVHFKGESSKKINYTYIKSFYGSMFIYLRKHQKGLLSKALIPLLSFAVFSLGMVKYSLSILSTFLWVLIDLVILALSFVGLSKFWASWYHQDPAYFDDRTRMILITLASLYVLFQYLYGKYDLKLAYINVVKGVFFAALTGLLFYAILPESLRFSRFLFAGSGLVAFVMFSLSFYWRRISTTHSRTSRKKAYIVVGSGQSAQEIKNLMDATEPDNKYLGYVSIKASESALGTEKDLTSILEQLDLDQIIFSTKEIPFDKILKTMSANGSKYNYQLASNDNISILSSHSAKKQGNIITVDVSFNLNNPVSRRFKRLFDLVTSVLLIICLPVLLIFSKSFRNRWSRLPSVLTGRRSIIGFEEQDFTLPRVKSGIFNLKDIFHHQLKEKRIDYVKRYSAFLDIEYLYLALRS